MITPRLPAETILQILYGSDIRDIIRWRRVSKWFRTITYDSALWKALYEQSTAPRPPGPSHAPSVLYIERTLVKATQLAQWTSQHPMRALSSVTFNTRDLCPRADLKLIHGRWVVVCKSARKFVLYDTDSHAKTHAPQVLWEMQKDHRVAGFDVASVISAVARGECLVYVLYTLNRLCWKMLEFRWDAETGELRDSTVINAPDWGSMMWTIRVKISTGDSPLLFIRSYPCASVLDTQTHIFYQIPNEYKVPPHLPELVTFQDMYLIHLTPISGCRHITHVRAFTLPPDGPPDENGNHTPRITHQAFLHFTLMGSINPILSTSIIDRDTEAANIMLMYPSYPGLARIRCLKLTLPKPSEPAVAAVLPIALEDKFVELGFQEPLWTQFTYVDASDDGHIRGFCRREIRLTRRRQLMNPENPDVFFKFDIDTTRTPWAIALGKIAPARWNHDDVPWIKDQMNVSMVFDGMRGKLCYRHRGKSNRITVVDIV